MKENEVKIHSKYRTLHREALSLYMLLSRVQKCLLSITNPPLLQRLLKKIQNYSQFHQAAQEKKH